MEIQTLEIGKCPGTADPGLNYLYSETTIYNEPPRHRHSFYEFFVVTEGTALHVINNSVQTIVKGDLIFIRPDDEHGYSFHNSEEFRKLNLAFSVSIFRSIANFFDQTELLTRLTESRRPPQVHIGDEALSQVVTLMQEAGALVLTDNITRIRYHIQCTLAFIFENYFFHYDNNSCGDSSQRIPSWLSILMTDMQSIDNLRIGYPRMCELAHCSENHLCRCMKQYSGMTPTEYINSLRLDYSVYLLTHTELGIMEISLECGFSNLSHYYHLFKRKFGRSPGELRK